MKADIHPKFAFNKKDADLISDLLSFGTPNKRTAQARLNWFDLNSHKMTNYLYWFALATIWVEYSGWTDLKHWRALYSANRPDNDCLMKPSEIEVFEELPELVTCYRAHRPNETDGISYTLDRSIAEKFLVNRPGGFIKEYQLPKSDILCLFLRRGEKELICLKEVN